MKLTHLIYCGTELVGTQTAGVGCGGRGKASRAVLLFVARRAREGVDVDAATLCAFDLNTDPRKLPRADVVIL
jgi:hypothetical protein